MFFFGLLYLYIYTCIVFTFVVTPCQNLPHQFNTSGNVITSQKSVFSNAIYIYVDAQLILNMYISFHSYIYIHTHMSFTSYVLMIVAFTPPFLALKHAFSSMGSSLRSGWIQCHETIEHRNGEMRLHLRERWGEVKGWWIHGLMLFNTKGDELINNYCLL